MFSFDVYTDMYFMIIPIFLKIMIISYFFKLDYTYYCL